MIWKITPEHRRRVNSLVRRLCSCCDRGNCILLDDGEPRRCVQLISRSGITCNYFKRAVLPADRELYGQLKRYNGKGVVQHEDHERVMWYEYQKCQGPLQFGKGE